MSTAENGRFSFLRIVPILCIYCSGGCRDRAGIPIDHDALAAAQTLGCHADPRTAGI